MASTFTHSDAGAIREAFARLHDLRECIIRHVVWSEPQMALTIDLTYIWTADGRVCFTVGQESQPLRLHFRVVDQLTLHNALSAAMLAHPELINWGVSEIARVEVVESAPEGGAFTQVRFVWEGHRHIEVAFRDLTITLGATDVEGKAHSGLT